MTHEEFVGMVGRLEQLARRSPRQYRLCVGLLAALGYAYLLLVLALALLLVGWLLYVARLNWVVLKVGWVLLTFAGLVLRAMWVRMPPPPGVELRREEAPRLFALVDELTGRLRAPRISRVLLYDDFNAAVRQVPRLGPLGWHRNHLLLGLPLMQALSPEQFRAVLAHELGHLSGRHGHFSSRIYSVRQMWSRLLARLQEEGRWGSFVFVKFFDWYAPYFNAYSFVLARRHEYEADRASAELTSPEAAAEALAATNLKAARLQEEFWPEFLKQADEQREPAGGPFLRLASFLREPVPAEAGANFLRQALSRETDYDDTHPSLAERIAALGVVPAGDTAAAAAWAEQLRFEPLAESAAMHYFGPAHQSLAERVDALWREEIGPQWRVRHEYAVKARRRLAALDRRAEAGEPLSVEELWERACVTAEFVGPAESEPRLRELLARAPEHPQGHYALGQVLVSRGDESGVAHLERAMDAEPDLVLPACETLYGFMKERGRDEEAERYRARAVEHLRLAAMAHGERDSYRDGDALLPHGLGPEEVEAVREQLREYGRVKSAYLARKRVEHFADKPVYVLGVETEGRWYQSGAAEADAELLRQLSQRVELPGYGFFVILDRRFRQTKTAMQGMDGALIYGG